jgi:ABC-2 type transport system permease protein
MFNEQLTQITTEFWGAICIAKKDLRIYYMQPPVIMFGFIFPGFTYLAFTIGRAIDPILLLPGLAAITSFFAAGSIGPVVLPLERKTKTLERLLGAPFSTLTIIVGKTLSGAVFGLTMSVAPLLVGLIFLGMSITSPFLLIISMALSALTFAAFGIFFAAQAEEINSAMMPMNLIRFPMLFISGFFLPIEAMPGFLRPVAYFMPLTYAVDALRQTVLGINKPLMLWGDIVALGLFLGLFLGTATMALQRDSH